jgi:transposase
MPPQRHRRHRTRCQLPRLACATRCAHLPLPPPQRAKAAYIAPISPRPLPTNMRYHSTPQGRQLKSMDIPRNQDLLVLEADMLADTPRWAMLPTSSPFHRGLWRRICASMIPSRGVNLSLWTSLATLPARHTLWSTRLELLALGFCAFGPGSQCLFGFFYSSESTWCFAEYQHLVLVAVLYPISWFFWNKSGTRVCSFHVGFDFCHSGNAIWCTQSIKGV